MGDQNSTLVETHVWLCETGSNLKLCRKVSHCENKEEPMVFLSQMILEYWRCRGYDNEIMAVLGKVGLVFFRTGSFVFLKFLFESL